ncbi:hypothetical protein GCM10022204_40050 [Microlunatus aurantiacus]|uniref:Uncharacterized protein n=1 Tax=Microlunatus aurantiacus TaxID=446786 RepID=A0ABP7EA57_9ACTN
MAKDLITLAGGPSIFGVAALLGFLASTLAKTERDPRKGWYLLGGGLLLTGWLVMFIVIAAPTVVASWTATGVVSPTFVLLSATWLVTIVLTIVLVSHTRAVLVYLTDSYPPGAGPRSVKLFRSLVTKSSHVVSARS